MRSIYEFCLMRFFPFKGGWWVLSTFTVVKGSVCHASPRLLAAPRFSGFSSTVGSGQFDSSCIHIFRVQFLLWFLLCSDFYLLVAQWAHR